MLKYEDMGASQTSAAGTHYYFCFVFYHPFPSALGFGEPDKAPLLWDVEGHTQHSKADITQHRLGQM